MHEHARQGSPHLQFLGGVAVLYPVSQQAQVYGCGISCARILPQPALQQACRLIITSSRRIQQRKAIVQLQQYLQRTGTGSLE